MKKSKFIFSRDEIRSIFDPWPILFPKRARFVAFPEKFSKALNRLSCWRDAQGNRKTLRRFAFLVETEDFQGMRHSIRSLARSNIRIPFIVVDKRGIVYDGNHRMCALKLQGYKGSVLVIEAI